MAMLRQPLCAVVVLLSVIAASQAIANPLGDFIHKYRLERQVKTFLDADQLGLQQTLQDGLQISKDEARERAVTLAGPYAAACATMLIGRGSVSEATDPALERCSDYQALEQVLCLDNELGSANPLAVTQRCHEAPTYSQQFVLEHQTFADLREQYTCDQKDLAGKKTELRSLKAQRFGANALLTFACGLLPLFFTEMMVMTVLISSEVGASSEVIPMHLAGIAFSLAAGLIGRHHFSQKIFSHGVPYQLDQAVKGEARLIEQLQRNIYQRLTQSYQQQFPALFKKTGAIRGATIEPITDTNLSVVKRLEFERPAYSLETRYVRDKGLVIYLCTARKTFGHTCNELQGDADLEEEVPSEEETAEKQ